MAQMKVTKHHEFMEDHGDDYRIERDYTGQPDGSYNWTVFKREHTGLQLKDENKSDKGEDAGPGVRSYAVNVIKKAGVHPVHKTDTGLSHVWMPVFKGPENAARMRLRSLVEGK
jgi:hypothetical protein